MTLELSPDAMRAFGYRVVDVIVDHMAALDGKRVTGGGERQALDDRLGGPPPEDGEHGRRTRLLDDGSSQIGRAPRAGWGTNTGPLSGAAVNPESCFSGQ